MTKDSDRLRALIARRTPEIIAEVTRMKAVGDQAGIDALLQIVHCPQEVEAHESGQDWVTLWPKGAYNWKTRAWIRDNLTGKFCLWWGSSAVRDYELRFEKPDDAFAFKMRFC